MSELTNKYASVIALAQELGCTGVSTSEEGGRLAVSGASPTTYALNQLWDRIKEVDAGFADISVNMPAQRTDIYGEYEVQPGDNLTKIAQHVTHGKLSYQQIFEANTDQLDDPNMIRVGQKLVIPNF